MPSRLAQHKPGKKMPLKRLLVLDGVVAVCRFQDDGSIIDAVGMLPSDMLTRLAKFAQWYRRMVSGNTDLLSLFSQMRGWAPSQGWIVHGAQVSVCSVANLVCMVQNDQGSMNEIMAALTEAAHN
jgi:roadblock/LC7 domain-containing protein